jgi:hypothetical protein
MIPLARILRLSPREWRDLGAAQVALLRAQWQLRRRPVGTLVRREGERSAGPTGSRERALGLALAIERAAERGVFRPRCLARSLALRDLLARHGITGSTIRVGVRQEQGRLLAHAWVRWGDLVLGDRQDWVARFTEVDDLRVLRDS